MSRTLWWENKTKQNKTFLLQKLRNLFLQGFGRRRTLLARPLVKEFGIGSIILENPFCIRFFNRALRSAKVPVIQEREVQRKIDWEEVHFISSSAIELVFVLDKTWRWCAEAEVTTVSVSSRVSSSGCPKILRIKSLTRSLCLSTLYIYLQKIKSAQRVRSLCHGWRFGAGEFSFVSLVRTSRLWPSGNNWHLDGRICKWTSWSKIPKAQEKTWWESNVPFVQFPDGVFGSYELAQAAIPDSLFVVEYSVHGFHSGTGKRATICQVGFGCLTPLFPTTRCCTPVCLHAEAKQDFVSFTGCHEWCYSLENAAETVPRWFCVSRRSCQATGIPRKGRFPLCLLHAMSFFCVCKRRRH